MTQTYVITDNRSGAIMKRVDDAIIPFNERNALIQEADIKELFARFDVCITTVHKLNLYHTAFTHPSYTKRFYWYYASQLVPLYKASYAGRALDLRDKSFETLEFVGDTIFKCVLSKYLFERYDYQGQDEGFMTRLKIKIEEGKSFALFARVLNLSRFMIISAQLEYNNARDSNTLLEDCFEALIAALYMDQGFQCAEQFIYRLLETEVDYSDLLYRDTNFKDQLLRFFHDNGWSHPVYEEVRSTCSGGKHEFTVLVRNNKGEVVAQATESKKNKAEQKCSMLALIRYKQLYPDQIVNDFD